jgi:hypothetical protein
LLALSLVAIALVGIIGLELREGSRLQTAALAQPGSQLLSPSASASHERSEHQYHDEEVARILARPLFSPTRRPSAPAPVSKDAAPGLARLSGVILGPAGKSAIFAGNGGGKPVVVGEGAQIGNYVVTSIDIGTVTVTGPVGKRILHPAFDPNPPKPVIAAAPMPSAIVPPTIAQFPKK